MRQVTGESDLTILDAVLGDGLASILIEREALLVQQNPARRMGWDEDDFGQLPEFLQREAIEEHLDKFSAGQRLRLSPIEQLRTTKYADVRLVSSTSSFGFERTRPRIASPMADSLLREKQGRFGQRVTVASDGEFETCTVWLPILSRWFVRGLLWDYPVVVAGARLKRRVARRSG
jgi:hypothetical protein